MRIRERKAAYRIRRWLAKKERRERRALKRLARFQGSTT